MSPKNILLSAYSCDPSKGSEPGNGFNWAKHLSMSGHKVFCITTSKGKKAIEQQLSELTNLSFIYIDLPFGADKMYYWSKIGMYGHYLLWQWLAYKKANKIVKDYAIDLAHHITWGSIQQGSFLYKLSIPLVFGPAGGGQHASDAFKSYFGGSWDIEVKRKYISDLFLKYNPACRKMIKNAAYLLVSNRETEELVQKLGAKKTSLVLDAALPEAYFEDALATKPLTKEFKLLWVGRLMPRKGLPLVLEAMHHLKHYKHIKLTIVGHGELEGHIKKLINNLELKDTVEFVGKVAFDLVKDYYRSHHAFIFTSLRDSGGVQLMEAMGYGLPVITLDIHGQGLMVEKDRGIKIPLGTPEETVLALSKAVVQLEQNSELLSKLSANAKQFAATQTLEHKINYVNNKIYPLIIEN
ncbi:glycosyltransferase family 4 protein [Croceivirga sp. JEA036]|uniref:glycosyltransferase family 4 protein n=1 Tax=Croceivirga sp. JEA036 TaxID=2721162 RepID=UPI0014388EDF|nr:glycosyltransferase family 4 protein [Croceivirga sp. JEA036]NJB35395.1 glycosyltransferase family 4 protein [Croceivirga sp. JEA036]